MGCDVIQKDGDIFIFVRPQTTELKENSLPIGMIDINNTWSKYSSVEPGYIIARKYWGLGYATEATMRVM